MLFVRNESVNSKRTLQRFLFIVAGAFGVGAPAAEAQDTQAIQKAELASEVAAFLYSPSMAPSMNACVANRLRTLTNELASQTQSLDSIPKKSVQDARREQIAVIGQLAPIYSRSECLAIGGMYLTYMNGGERLNDAAQAKVIANDLTSGAMTQLAALLKAPQGVALTNGPWVRGNDFAEYLVRSEKPEADPQVVAAAQEARRLHELYTNENMFSLFGHCLADRTTSDLMPATIEKTKQIGCRAARVSGCVADGARTVQVEGTQMIVPTCSASNPSQVSVATTRTKVAVRDAAMECRTSKHLIIVDETDSPGVFRYRSWNRPKPMTDKPDMEVANGSKQVEGSGPCRYTQYRFTKGNVAFVVNDDVACLEEAPPSGSTGRLLVYINDEPKSDYWCSRP